MYAKNETQVSYNCLLSIVDTLRKDYCLVGGWAIYYLVNERYRGERKRDYLGSRDIDIGVPDLATLKALDAFLVREMRFEQLSFRYVKYFGYDTGEEVAPERAKDIPQYMLIPLFVDVMIPLFFNGVKEAVGFVPPDEPILRKVFGDESNRTTVRIGGRDVPVPTPAMVLSMKLNSVGNRTKDHKRIKDICDIVALHLFTGSDREELIEQGVKHADPEKVKTIGTALHKDDYRQAAGFLGIPVDTVRSVMRKFSRTASRT